MPKGNHKIKSIKDFTEENLRQEVFDMIWPYEKLKLDVARLDKLSEPSIVKVAAFLFKAQLVEHELKEFLFFLDEIIEKETSALPFKKVRTTKSVKDINERFGLGQLKQELKNYQSKDIIKIIAKIDQFKENRDKFTHRLYNEPTDINLLAKESEANQKDAAECLKLITVAKNKIVLEVYQLRINRLKK